MSTVVRDLIGRRQGDELCSPPSLTAIATATGAKLIPVVDKAMFRERSHVLPMP